VRAAATFQEADLNEAARSLWPDRRRTGWLALARHLLTSLIPGCGKQRPTTRGPL